MLEVVRLIRPLLGEPVEITLDLGDGLWPVLVDRAQFETTLINLATNARDAMPHGGRLTIATRNTRVTPQAPERNPEVPPGDYVVVEVADTGTGMSRDVLQRIFEPFFTTKGKSVGTGLGLSTVLGFIQQSGGYVGVESEPGHGTTFRLHLVRNEDDAFVSAAFIAAPHSVAGDAGHGERILVVEDNPGLRHIVLQQLRKRGYLVSEAADAAAAIRVLETTQQDLLFTDVMLPSGMTGHELADLARQRWPNLKVLLTSGFPDAMLQEPPTPGMPRLIGKPYREEALARTLREVLAG